MRGARRRTASARPSWRGPGRWRSSSTLHGGGGLAMALAACWRSNAKGADCRRSAPVVRGRSGPGLQFRCGQRSSNSAAGPSDGETVGDSVRCRRWIQLHQRAPRRVSPAPGGGAPRRNMPRAHHVEHLVIVGRLPRRSANERWMGGCRFIWLWLASLSGSRQSSGRPVRSGHIAPPQVAVDPARAGIGK